MTKVVELKPKKTVELFMSNVCGFIIPCESGIIWSNQAGGLNCTHPSVEGILLPLFSDLCCPEGIVNMWRGLGGYDQQFVDAFLDETSLDGAFRSLSDEELVLLTESGTCHLFGEAWLPLAVIDNPVSMSDILGPFAGQVGILTWKNSD